MLERQDNTNSYNFSYLLEISMSYFLYTRINAYIVEEDTLEYEILIMCFNLMMGLEEDVIHKDVNVYTVKEILCLSQWW